MTSSQHRRGPPKGTCEYLVIPTIYGHVDAVTDTAILALIGPHHPSCSVLTTFRHRSVVGLAAPVLLYLLGGVVDQTLVVSASYCRVGLL